MLSTTLSPALSYAIGLIRSADARVQAAMPGLAMGQEPSPERAMQLKMAHVEKEIAMKLVEMNSDSANYRINMIA